MKILPYLDIGLSLSFSTLVKELFNFVVAYLYPFIVLNKCIFSLPVIYKCIFSLPVIYKCMFSSSLGLDFLSKLRNYDIPGFGPFHHHEVNASAMAVRELMELELKDHVNLIIVELPVEYDAVREIVPLLWKEHSPLVI